MFGSKEKKVSPEKIIEELNITMWFEGLLGLLKSE